MDDIEMEEIISKLSVKGNKNNKYNKISEKIKNLFKELHFFSKIIQKYPDNGDFILNEIISNLHIRKYNKFEIIWDDKKNTLKGIFIILLGIVNVYTYNYQYKSKSNEIKINILPNKQEKNNISQKVNPQIKGLKSNNANSINEDIEPLQIDSVLIKGDSIGQTFLKNIFKNEILYNNDNNINYIRNQNNIEIDKKEKNNKKYYYKIESKTKSIIGFLTEENYNMIIEKLLSKERHERYNFLHRINYMPKDASFIDRFQNNINKKYFFKGSIIFNQSEEFKTFYIIHTGTVRMSINFNRQFFCSLDFDVLMGKHINDRFTSNRFFEVEGNYKEKEKFVVVDLENGEILGGIEFCKEMKNYIFTAQCVTDVILYEINLKFFDNILSYWSFQRFYEKITQQFDYFKDRIKSINDFKKEKEKIDDYSFEQNKFIQTYKRGYPLSEKKDEYLSKFTNHFKFDKIFKSKELKMHNTRYNKKVIQNGNKNDKQGDFNFITNVPNKKKKKKLKRKLVKSKTMMNIKFENSKLEEKIKEIKEKHNLEEIKELKEHEQNNDNEEDKSISQNLNEDTNKQIIVNENDNNNENNLKEEPIKIIKRFRHFNSSMNITSKNIKRNSSINNNFSNNNSSNNNIFERKDRAKRLNSCRIDNDNKALIKHNLYQKLIYLNSGNKNNKNRLILRKIFKLLNDENEAKHKNNNRKIINRRAKSNNFKQNSRGNSRKNISDRIKYFSSGTQVYLSYNKKSSPLESGKKNLSQPKINEKNLIFPIGIQEMNIDKYTNINNLLPILPSFINNSYIRNELKIKNKNNINALMLLQNYSKLKNKKLKLC